MISTTRKRTKRARDFGTAARGLPVRGPLIPVLIGLLLTFAIPQSLFAQQGRVYKERVTPNWSDDGNSFWYRNDLAEGKRQYILVDVRKGLRGAAFDNIRLAKSLDESGAGKFDSERFDFRYLEFDVASDSILFGLAGKDWKCNLSNYDLEESDERSGNRRQNLLKPIAPTAAPRASNGSQIESEITFKNETKSSIELFWVDTDGNYQSYGKLEPGKSREQHTFAGHVWRIVHGDSKKAVCFVGAKHPMVAVVSDESFQVAAEEKRKNEVRSSRQLAQPNSPDGKLRAIVRDQQIVLNDLATGSETILTDDGDSDLQYQSLLWSPDSTRLLALRMKSGDQGLVHLIESSPKEGGRAKLHSRPYPLPGDKFDSYELRLFDVEKQTLIKTVLDPVDFGRPQIRWREDGKRFTYEKIDRGHQRFRLIEVDATTGQSRAIIDERPETFVWTAHAQNLGARKVTWLASEEIILLSEIDGWRHLYLVNPDTAESTPITKGGFVVRRIERIDQKNRQIWFAGSGQHADQDPYFIHHYRVNFDGTGLTALTEGNGDHSIEYSPDGRFMIDTYSRVDMPPVHELRSVEDGRLACHLEEADISELEANGWTAPAVFSAKGRDGKTDIWGFVCRPKNFDPAKKYPVIEAIYAGPHDSYVPKRFSKRNYFSNLTDYGFAVAKVDGMGTANRSKEFHDVCWRNLKDAGLPDRILWHQAFAKENSWYDISRVGIFGGSAGGQSSTGALLFHPDFYKVAVSSCGCHDNRMDKASWNEQWMGYPVGPHYAESSNIENAFRLKGKLMLIVGELDRNVPTESTYRLVDALIKADKDFDLIVIPGAGHGDGGSYGERRRREFFEEHLMKK